MSRFSYEPNEKLVRGHVVELRTARDVLCYLNVQDADVAEQSEAVAKWLDQNVPDELLRTSLTRMGFPVEPEEASQ